VYALGAGVASHDECQDDVCENPLWLSARRPLDNVGMDHGDLDSIIRTGYDAVGVSA
jgi:hypothetical protein